MKVFRLSVIVFILFMIFFNFTLIYRLLGIKKETKEIINLERTIMEERVQSLNDNFVISIQNSNISLPDKIFHQLSFYGKTKDSTLLVVRFSEYDCSECVEFILIKIRKFIEKNDTKVVFLTTFQENRTIQIILKKYDLGWLPNYNVEILDNIPIEKMHYPYCFTIDNSKKISNLFLPSRSVPMLTDKYLSLIENRFCN